MLLSLHKSITDETLDASAASLTDEETFDAAVFSLEDSAEEVNSAVLPTVDGAPDTFSDAEDICRSFLTLPLLILKCKIK
jgi:hypothetical protein